MKISEIIKYKIDKNEKERFEKDILIINLKRGRIIAIFVIIFEFVLISIDMITCLMNTDDHFRYNQYFAMYFFMVIINVFYLIFAKRNENILSFSPKKFRSIQVVFILYISFILCWGSIVTLMDQNLYGQAIAYMLNLSVCSTVFYLNNKKFLIPYGLSALILLIGLPFFQSSKEILIAHYANLCFFALVLWFASRIIYHGYCTSYKNMVLLKRSKIQLQKEIEQNIEINQRLAIINSQLKELTLIDELTGIPNRRSFRNFIDMIFENFIGKDLVLSVMMIDIDNFKQYNDHYGHDEGDNALIAVANQIFSVIQNPMEFAVRWGGEEFLFAGVYKDREEIGHVAELIRKRVNDLRIPHAFSGIDGCITISIGFSTIQLNSKISISKVVSLADKALYAAKNSGRNCVKEI